MLLWKKVKNFSANATATADEDKGISAWYNGATKADFDAVINRLIDNMDTTTDEDCNYKSAIDNVYYYYGTRTVNEKQYDIVVMFYLADKTYAGITFAKNDIYFCSFENTNNSNPGGGSGSGGDSGSGGSSSGGGDSASQYQQVETWTRPGDYKNKNDEIIRIGSDASILFVTNNKSGHIYTDSSFEYYFKIGETYTKFESYKYYFIYDNLKYSMENADKYTAVVDSSEYAGTYEDSDGSCLIIDEIGNAKGAVNYVIYSKDGELYLWYVDYEQVVFTKVENEYTSLTFSEEIYTKVDPWERMTDTTAIAGEYTSEDDSILSIDDEGVATINNILCYTLYKRGSGSAEEYALELVGAYFKITINGNVITLDETEYYKPTPFSADELSEMETLVLGVDKLENLTTETYGAELFDKTLLKFTPSQTGTYYFYSRYVKPDDYSLGGADAFLYNSNNKYLAIVCDYGRDREDCEFLISIELTADTTYILALSIDYDYYAGDYNIYVSATDPE